MTRLEKRRLNQRAADKERDWREQGGDGRWLNPIGAAREFMRRMSEGRSCRDVESDEDMPGRRTVLSWVRMYAEDLEEEWRIAREHQSEGFVDHIADALPDIRSGEINAMSANAWVKATQFTVEKLAPKKFGPKQALDHTTGGERIKTFSDMYSSSAATDDKE